MSQYLLESYIQLNNENLSSYEILGMIFYKLQDFSRAKDAFNKMLEIDPNSVMAFTNLSMCHMQLGEKEIAEDFKAKSMEASRQSSLGIETLGKTKNNSFDSGQSLKEQISTKLEKITKSMNLFERILKIDEEDLNALNGLGNLLLEKFELEKSLFDSHSNNNQSDSLKLSELIKEAKSYFLKAKYTEANDFQSLWGLGKIAAIENDLEGMLENCELAKKIALKEGKVSLANEINQFLLSQNKQ
jgi:tetratricopeptide (TPR) repeat protein